MSQGMEVQSVEEYNTLPRMDLKQERRRSKDAQRQPMTRVKPPGVAGAAAACPQKYKLLQRRTQAAEQCGYEACRATKR